MTTMRCVVAVLALTACVPPRWKGVKATYTQRQLDDGRTHLEVFLGKGGDPKKHQCFSVDPAVLAEANGQPLLLRDRGGEGGFTHLGPMSQTVAMPDRACPYGPCCAPAKLEAELAAPFTADPVIHVTEGLDEARITATPRQLQLP